MRYLKASINKVHISGNYHPFVEIFGVDPNLNLMKCRSMIEYRYVTYFELKNKDNTNTPNDA